jgi:hypothetical protein
VYWFYTIAIKNYGSLDSATIPIHDRYLSNQNFGSLVHWRWGYITVPVGAIGHRLGMPNVWQETFNKKE